MIVKMMILIIVLILIFKDFISYYNKNNKLIAKGLYNINFLTIDSIVIVVFIIFNFYYSINSTDIIFSLSSIILIFIIILKNMKNIIYENIIFVNGVGYEIKNIDEFEWSDKKNKKVLGNIKEYYTLNLTVKNKSKILDDYKKKIYIDIEKKDKKKVDLSLNKIKVSK